MNHVEFVGIAGAGKSTLAANLRDDHPTAESIGERYGRVVADLVFPRPVSRLGGVVPVAILSNLGRACGVADRGVNYFSLRNPEMLPTTSELIAKYAEDSRRIDFVSGKTLDLVEKFGAIEEFGTDDGTLLLDEGFAFAAASILHPPQATRPFSESDLRDYAETVPVPDVVVFVRASPETCLRRLRRRDEGFPASWTRADATDHYEFAREAGAVAESVVEVFRSHGAEIVEVDTDENSVRTSVAAVRERALE